jgi:hypothetical protein
MSEFSRNQNQKQNRYKMIRSLALLVLIVFVVSEGSNESFMSSDGITISTSPIETITTTPVEAYNYLIDGITYYIVSATKLTADQVKEKLSQIKQQQQQANQQANIAIEQANKVMEQTKEMLANISQNIQNQFGSFFKKSSKRDILLTISPIYDPTVQFLPVHTYIYNNNGTKLYLTSTKTLNDTQIKDAVASFKQRYNDEKKLSEQIYSNVLTMNQKMFEIQNQYMSQFQQQMQNITNQMNDFYNKMNTSFFNIF